MLKGEDLINILLIRERESMFEEFTDVEIYLAIRKCKHMLDYCNLQSIDSVSKNFSARQKFCAEATIILIMSDEYTKALHEFVCCIDDYEDGIKRNITINEQILYSCLLGCFMARIKEKSKEQNEIEIISKMIKVKE